MKIGLLFIALFVFTGCFTGSGKLPPRMSQNDFNRWSRCMNTIADAQCGGDRDPVYRGACGRGLADQYAAQPDEQGKKQWLIHNGCPPYMVE